MSFQPALKLQEATKGQYLIQYQFQAIQSNFNLGSQQSPGLCVYLRFFVTNEQVDSKLEYLLSHIILLAFGQMCPAEVLHIF